MAVVSAKEMIDEGSRTADVTEDGRRLTRLFLVQCDSRNDGVSVAIAATGIPRIRDLHPTESNAWARNIHAEPHGDSGFYFLVSVDYSTPIFGDSFGVPQHANPLMRPAKYEWAGVPRQVLATHAAYYGMWYLKNDGTMNTTELKDIGESGVVLRPVMSSALETFAPSPDMPGKIDLALTISRNVAAVDPAGMLAVNGSVNDSPFMGAPAGSVLLSEIRAASAAETYEDSSGAVFTLQYWEVQYELRFRLDGWWTDILDEGTLYLEDAEPGENRVQRPIVDTDTGYPRQTPTRLDGSGNELLHRDVTAFPDAPQAYFMRYLLYPLVDFSALGLV